MSNLLLVLALFCTIETATASELQMMTLPYIRVGMVLSVDFTPTGITVHEKNYYRLATFFLDSQKALNYRAFIYSQPLMLANEDGSLSQVFSSRPGIKGTHCKVLKITKTQHSPPVKEIKDEGFYIAEIQIENQPQDSFEVELTYSYKGALSSWYGWYPVVEYTNFIPPIIFERGSYSMQISATGSRVEVDNLETYEKGNLTIGFLRSLDRIPIIKLTPLSTASSNNGESTQVNPQAKP
jgi:hypothetical protein